MNESRWLLLPISTLLLLGTGCASVSPQGAAKLFSSPPTPVPQQVLAGPQAGLSKRLGDLLRTTRAELDGLDEKHAAPLAKLETELGELRQSDAPAAKTRLSELQLELASVAAELSDRQLDVRYARGSELLSEMIASAEVTEQVIDTLSMEGALPAQKNHWGDQELRNDYDAASDWGMVGGAAVAAVGGVLIAIGGAEERNPAGPGDEGVTTLTIGGAMVAAGTAVVGAAATLGHVLGAEDGDDLKDKAQAVEDTRRVHDELNVRIERLRSFKSSVTSLRQKLSALQKTYDQAGPDRRKRRATVARLQRHTARFMGTVERGAELLDWFAALPAKYGDGAAVGQLATDLQQLTTVVESAEKLFRDGVAGFRARDEEITELFGQS